MISNIDRDRHDNYYDLVHNRITVRGFSYSDGAEELKILIYPKVLQNIYCISKDGLIYSIVNNNYISWSVRNYKPYVNLSSLDDNRNIVLEPYYIKDLVAYNYIANASSYLERGCHSTNIDGNSMNCNYSNIMYIGPDF